MYLFIDTDPGLDDILAISYLLTSNKYEIVGMSSVAGNVHIDCTTKNLQFICGIINKQFNKNITIYRGLSKPIVNMGINAQKYHGIDGLGEFWSSNFAQEKNREITECLNHCVVSDVPAVFGLIELSKKYTGKLVIMAIGPLSNIAIAQRIDPEFGSRLKEIFVMGGELTGRGNCDKHFAAEFNFSSDPEAAYIVFHEIPCRKTLLPLEPVRELSIFPESSNVWLKNLENKTDFLSIIKYFALRFCSKSQKSFRFYDLVLAILLIEPNLTTDHLTTNATVELTGKFTRGKVVIDFSNKGLDGLSEINLIQSTNREVIFQRFNSFFS